MSTRLEHGPRLRSAGDPKRKAISGQDYFRATARVSGFRFALTLEDGEPADPAMFATVILTWRIGDTFLAGSELQRLRIGSSRSSPGLFP